MEVRGKGKVWTCWIKLIIGGLEHYLSLIHPYWSPVLFLGPYHPAPTPSLTHLLQHFPVGWEWALTTSSSTIGYSRGFGGRSGVEADKRDKAALGYDYKGETEKHESQRGELGSERREVTEYMGPSSCPSWKLTQDPEYGGADMQWKWWDEEWASMCGGRCRETNRMERKTARLGAGQRKETSKRRGHWEMDEDGQARGDLAVLENPLHRRERAFFPGDDWEALFNLSSFTFSPFLSLLFVLLSHFSSLHSLPSVFLPILFHLFPSLPHFILWFLHFLLNLSVFFIPIFWPFFPLLPLPHTFPAF